MADEALGIGPIVLLAPISLFLEFRGDLGVAQGADIFGNTVFGAPPAAVLVTSVFLCRFTGMFMPMVRRSSGLFSAAAEKEASGRANGGNQAREQLHISSFRKNLDSNFHGLSFGLV
jgi:hypothetical protein